MLEKYLNKNNVKESEFPDYEYPLNQEEVLHLKELAKNKKLNYYEKTNIYKAQEIIKGSNKVKIAILDSGILTDHEEFSDCLDQKNCGKSFAWWDLTYDPKNVYDENGHGTHVAGIITGKNVGIAPNCKMYPLKVLDKKGRLDRHPNILLKALDWCYQEDIDLINISFGGYKPLNDILKEKFNKISNNKIIVALAGNNYTGANFPSVYPNIVSAGSVDNNFIHSDFSNIWFSLNISAPGEKIFSSYIYGTDIYNNKSYGYNLGTGNSQSTSFITGVLALGLSLLKENNIDYKLNEIISTLYKSVIKKSLKLEETINVLNVFKSEFNIIENDIHKINRYMYGNGIIDAEKFLINLIKEYNLKR